MRWGRCWSGIPLDTAAGGVQSDRWLQQALYKHPESLPVKEIDPHIVSDLHGDRDGVRAGRHPLPHAHRSGRAGRDQALAQSGLRSRYPEADEAAFVDGVRRSLSTGDFLLIIVGDGIRYGAESLVAFLERYGHLRFGLALVEVAAYKLPDGAILLQPRVLAKTELLQRMLLLGPSGPVTLQQAAQAEDAADQNRSARGWFQAFWAEFLAQLRLDDPALMPTEPAKSTNQFFPMPPGCAMAWVSAGAIAVGMPVTGHPPHKSQRAQLTHWAPTLGV